MSFWTNCKNFNKQSIKKKKKNLPREAFIGFDRDGES
jgi:hypothetical protein